MLCAAHEKPSQYDYSCHTMPSTLVCKIRLIFIATNPMRHVCGSLPEMHMCLVVYNYYHCTIWCHIHNGPTALILRIYRMGYCMHSVVDGNGNYPLSSSVQSSTRVVLLNATNLYLDNLNWPLIPFGHTYLHSTFNTYWSWAFTLSWCRELWLATIYLFSWLVSNIIRSQRYLLIN